MRFDKKNYCSSVVLKSVLHIYIPQVRKKNEYIYSSYNFSTPLLEEGK